jgi:hypothetical protein
LLIRSSYAQNLFTNSGFELPVTANGNFLTLGPGNGISGWQITGQPGNAVGVANTNYAEASIRFPAQSGLNALDLSGAGNTGPANGINQNVATVVGQEYNLSFWVGNADGSGNASYLLPSTVLLSIDGATPMAFTNGDVDFQSVNWRLFTTTFQANFLSTNIAFYNGTGLADAYTGLDNVALTAVPEPAGWILFLLGATSLQMVLRRGHA